MSMNAKPMIEVENVKKYFKVAGAKGRNAKVVKAVDGVSLTIYEGETYGLVGETGCGKSTLGRCILRLLDTTEGNVRIDGQEIAHLSQKDLRKARSNMQMVFQDPFTSLNPRKRVGEILEEAMEINHIGTKENRMEIALEMMKKVGLRQEHYFRYPHEFSGGQRQRIGLARALVLNPKVIVCDEPVSALDVSIQSQIINLLLDLQEENKLTYLFIAHDMSVVKYISARIGVMYLGHLVEEATTDDLFGMPYHPYSQALLSAVPQTNPHVKKQRIILNGDVPSPIDPPSGCVFHTRCPYAMEICSKEPPCMKMINREHRVACHLYDDNI